MRPLVGCVARTLRQVISLHEAPSVAALARVAGISRSHLHAMLAGRHNTRLDTLADLAEALSITPWVFLVDWEPALLAAHVRKGPIQRTADPPDGG